MGISQGSRITLFMDMDNANKHFNLKPELLEADDQNFAHDINGIQTFIDRKNKAFSAHWVPRMATPADELKTYILEERKPKDKWHIVDDFHDKRVAKDICHSMSKINRENSYRLLQVIESYEV